MRLGYNTNGLAHHSLEDAIRLLADIGYRSVAITLDHQHLNPFDAYLDQNLEKAKELLSEYGMSLVVETGARFLLDARQKHAPTIFDPSPANRVRRVDFWCKAIDVAAQLGSDCVSIWSGVAPVGSPDDTKEQWELLIESLVAVVAHAEKREVVVGFEPEPGMFIDTMDKFNYLLDRMPNDHLKLTLDVGHLHCMNELDVDKVAELFGQWKGRMVNVHIEDMVHGVHEHLMFGEGEMEFPPILKALQDVGYEGSVHVELSRHSHDGANAAQRAFDFLSPLAEWK